MEPFLAEIIMFGGNFAPRGWAFCDGQLLPISQYSALFSILGTTFGGDGRTTFALPDLRGRVAIHPGNGPGLSSYKLGQKGGRESVTLTINELPSHTHTGAITNVAGDAPPGGVLRVNSGGGDDKSPVSNFLAEDASEDNFSTTHDGSLSGAGSVIFNDIKASIGNTGGSRSFDIRQPWLGINHIIALQGTFPSRS